jgi:membrane protein implicated in regulation of membrane protease activity
VRLVSRFGLLIVVAGLAYLGFYVYGVVLGVFSPVELIGFTALALVFAGLFAVHIVRVRRAMRTPEQRAEMMREAHVYRERRGF